MLKFSALHYYPTMVEVLNFSRQIGDTICGHTVDRYGEKNKLLSTLIEELFSTDKKPFVVAYKDVNFY